MGSRPHGRRVLRLQPAVARPAPIEAAGALRHDLLQAQLAGRGDTIALGQNPISLTERTEPITALNASMGRIPVVPSEHDTGAMGAPVRCAIERNDGLQSEEA
jgi:hypothetical protein